MLVDFNPLLERKIFHKNFLLSKKGLAPAGKYGIINNIYIPPDDWFEWRLVERS